GDARRTAEALRHALEDGGPVVRLVHDDELAFRLGTEMERCEHPRYDEDRVGAGPEEGAGHPAMRVCDLAEVRNVAFDAGQVLEIGRWCEKEQVDAVRLHALAELPPALCVVEHHE